MDDSMRVAEHFGKRHDNVLRDYDRLECSDAFRRLNFEETIVSRQNFQPTSGALLRYQ
jgi:Rha family phage regulatory protein